MDPDLRITRNTYSARRNFHQKHGGISKSFKLGDYKSKEELVKAADAWVKAIKDDNEKFRKEKIAGKYTDSDRAWVKKLIENERSLEKKIDTLEDKKDKIEGEIEELEDMKDVIEDEKEAIEGDIKDLMIEEEEVVPEKIISIRPVQLPDVDITFDKPEQSSIVIYGSSKRGKSTLLEHLFNKYYNKKEYISTLFSPNAHLKFYNGFNAKCSTFNDRTARYLQMEQAINMRTENKYKFFNAFDDIIHAKYAKVVGDLVCTFRNANMSTILLVQYDKMISKQNRANLNHIIMFGFNQDEAIENMIKSFCMSYFRDLGMEKLPEMVKFYKDMTDDHGFIYVDPIRGIMTFHKLKIKKNKHSKRKRSKKKDE
jgi:hypothetical protein